MEQDFKKRFMEAVNEHKRSKALWENEKKALEEQIANLKDELASVQDASRNQFSKNVEDMNKLLQLLSAEQYEVDLLKKEVAKLTTEAEENTSLKAEVEMLKTTLQPWQTLARNYGVSSAHQLEVLLENISTHEVHKLQDMEAEVEMLNAKLQPWLDLARKYGVRSAFRFELLERYSARESQKLKAEVEMLKATLQPWQTLARSYGVTSAYQLELLLEKISSHEAKKLQDMKLHSPTPEEQQKEESDSLLVEYLRRELDTAQKDLKWSQYLFKNMNDGYKEAFYDLVGYKIEIIGYRRYCLTSRYAQSQEDYFTFTVYNNIIKMQQSDSMEEMVQFYMDAAGPVITVPVLLSGFTLELYNKACPRVPRYYYVD